MPQAFPHLFAPLDLRHKTLKHRLNFGAHTTNVAEDGLIDARAESGPRSTRSATASPRAGRTTPSTRGASWA